MIGAYDVGVAMQTAMCSVHPRCRRRPCNAASVSREIGPFPWVSPPPLPKRQRCLRSLRVWTERTAHRQGHARQPEIAGLTRTCMPVERFGECLPTWPNRSGPHQLSRLSYLDNVRQRLRRSSLSGPETTSWHREDRSRCDRGPCLIRYPKQMTRHTPLPLKPAETEYLSHYINLIYRFSTKGRRGTRHQRRLSSPPPATSWWIHVGYLA